MLTVKDTYLYLDDKPFFYLGDTAWELFYKLSEEEALIYLENRRDLGFNVIQSILYLNDKPRGLDIKDLNYWSFVKKIVNKAKDLGLYFGLLPAWGSIIKTGVLNKDNILEYANFLGKYFKDCDNIIWILGGDIRGDSFIDVYDILGNTLKKYNPNRLMTFHPFGRTGSYLWFNDKNWLDFNMFQSGHRRYDQLTLNAWDDKCDNEDSFGEDSYKYVIKAKTYKNVKPILDGEPSYEGVVQGLHDLNEPYWEARHVRRYAYWSVLEGACGFTYGNNAMIQFHRDGEVGTYGVRETWVDALASTGASYLKPLKELFLEFDFTKGRSTPELILSNRERHHHISCFSSSDYVICYTYKGDNIKLDLTKYKNKEFKAYWMNPENNIKCYFNKFKGGSIIDARPPKKHELNNDWVLILK